MVVHHTGVIADSRYDPLVTWRDGTLSVRGHFLPASEQTRHGHASQSSISRLVWPMQNEYLSCSSLVTTAEFSFERVLDHASNMHQNFYTSASLINWNVEWRVPSYKCKSSNWTFKSFARNPTHRRHSEKWTVAAHIAGATTAGGSPCLKLSRQGVSETSKVF